MYDHDRVKFGGIRDCTLLSSGPIDARASSGLRYSFSQNSFSLEALDHAFAFGMVDRGAAVRDTGS